MAVRVRITVWLTSGRVSSRPSAAAAAANAGLAEYAEAQPEELAGALSRALLRERQPCATNAESSGLEAASRSLAELLPR